MSYQVGSFTQGSTGNTSITGLTFLPAGVHFTISSRFNTDETINTFSVGFTDGTRQKAHSTFRDGTGAKTRAYTDRCINHFKRNTNIDNDIVATIVSFDNNGGGDFGFTLNFTAADSNYQIHFEAYA